VFERLLIRGSHTPLQLASDHRRLCLSRASVINVLMSSFVHILEAVNFIKDRMATKNDLADLRNEMHEGFASINRRLDHIIQTQLDEHATRIKKLEAAVFSK
jgi:hypothetical protein